jgi:hypothetical protein
MDSPPTPHSLLEQARNRSDAAAWRRLVDQHAQFERQALQGVLHQVESRIAIQGELDLAAGGSGGDSRLGRLGLVSVVSLRIGSFPGGSSFLVKGKATSSRAAGREEPSFSRFNQDRDNLSPCHPSGRSRRG